MKSTQSEITKGEFDWKLIELDCIMIKGKTICPILIVTGIKSSGNFKVL